MSEWNISVCRYMPRVNAVQYRHVGVLPDWRAAEAYINRPDRRDRPICVSWHDTALLPVYDWGVIETDAYRNEHLKVRD